MKSNRSEAEPISAGRAAPGAVPRAPRAEGWRLLGWTHLALLVDRRHTLTP